MRMKKLAFPMVLVSVAGLAMWAHGENKARPQAVAPVQEPVVAESAPPQRPEKHFVFGKFHVIALGAANNNTLLRDVTIYSNASSGSKSGSKSKIVIQCEIARRNPQDPERWVLEKGWLRMYDYSKQPTKKWGTATSSSSFQKLEAYLR